MAMLGVILVILAISIFVGMSMGMVMMTDCLLHADSRFC